MIHMEITKEDMFKIGDAIELAYEKGMHFIIDGIGDMHVREDVEGVILDRDSIVIDMKEYIGRDISEAICEICKKCDDYVYRYYTDRDSIEVKIDYIQELKSEIYVSILDYYLLPTI